MEVINDHVTSTSLMNILSLSSKNPPPSAGCN